MSTQHSEEPQVPAYRRAARSQPCPRCGALIGQPCRTPKGRATSEHSVRYAITQPAQNIGYEEGLRDALDLLDWKADEGIEEIRKQIAIQHDMVRRHNLRREQEQVVLPGVQP